MSTHPKTLLKKRTGPPGAGKAPHSPARSELTYRILAVIKKIPRGRIASYGQIAALAGSPRGARQVARLLHTLSDRENLPWHRVVNRDCRISLPMDQAGALQRRLLLKEGVAVDESGAIDAGRYVWRPGKKRSGESRGGTLRI